MNIGGFSNISQNNLGFKPNGQKRYLKATADIVEIEKKLASGLSVDDLSDEEYRKLNAFDKAESQAFIVEVNKEIAEAERIAKKMAKGENLTAEEKRLISEKYPDLEKEAQQAKSEAEDLKRRIQQAKTQEEKQQISTIAMNGVATMLSSGAISSVQAQIKLAAIEEVIKQGNGKSENITIDFDGENIRKGSFLNKEV